MLNNKKNIPLLIGMSLIFIGSLLPSIRIANENINFLKENGPITIILILTMFILLVLNKKTIITLPSILSISIIIKFIIDNKTRLKSINEIYNCYADFKYGLSIMIIGNIIILITILLTTVGIKEIINFTKKISQNIKIKIKQIITFIQEKLNNRKKIIKPAKIKKIEKKENKRKIVKETTRDGKIKYNKIVVKVDNKPKKEKVTLKEKISLFMLKHRIKKISKKNITITKYKEDNQKKYYMPVIDIKKWTRNNICCINCGATISSNSEYCFLCDCKIKLNEKEEKIS